ncbi:UNVERIFIED_CONTAM: hypothetical protein Scaly_2024500 [Sesamum calycinum]|uniref:RNase H type-1 domain-containing protein n=1 Tax=Sesamum calycinum TaxID=2727403 RepID=A0AAW2N3D3_9LAMI
MEQKDDTLLSRKWPSTGDHSQTISPLFSFTPYKGEDERTLEADFGEARYFRSIGEMGCRIKAPTEDAPKVEKWLLHVDGSSPTKGSGAGAVITSPCGEDLEFDVKFGFKASNKEVEYEALSHAYEDSILDMASDACVVRHSHHKSYPVQSEYVAKMVDSKR